MEKQEQVKYVARVFSYLMRMTLNGKFVFPGGHITDNTILSCIEALRESFQSGLSEERLNDFCICQVYAVSGYGRPYLSRWKVSHSFGKKAIGRFTHNTRQRRFYQDKWLEAHGLTREGIGLEFRDRKEHPLAKFIYPEFEDQTKLRMHNTQAGFYICQLSTLLWTPFSVACLTCNYQNRCKEITGKKYGELLRIRQEELKKQTGNERS